MLFISIFFLSCNEPEEFISLELLDNASVEDGNQTPVRWFVVDGDYQKGWSELESSEGNRSLELTSDMTGGEFGYWGQSVTDDIPYGRKLKLSCDIKLEEVTGEGVSIAVRGDSNTKMAIFFETTQGKNLISGNQEWENYTVEMTETVPEEVTKILVFLLLLDDTKGTVYFDNISLKAF
jgi:hypothetical protein